MYNIVIQYFIDYTPSVQFSHSVVSNCLQPHGLRMPGFPVHHQLPELTQIHVHQVSDAIQPSHPLLSHSPPAFNLSQHHGLFMSQFFASGGQSIGVSVSALSPSNEHPGLISFRMDWLDLLAVQGTLKSLLQTIVQKHQFFGTQLSSHSNSHIHT